MQDTSASTPTADNVGARSGNRPADNASHADRRRTALMEAAPTGLTFVQLMLLGERSRHQVRSGLAALRDLCAERGWPPVLYTRDLGHHFSASEAELEVWELAWISGKLTQPRRMVTGTLAPRVALFPKCRWGGSLLLQLQAMESLRLVHPSPTSASAPGSSGGTGLPRRRPAGTVAPGPVLSSVIALPAPPGHQLTVPTSTPARLRPGAPADGRTRMAELGVHRVG